MPATVPQTELILVGYGVSGHVLQPVEWEELVRTTFYKLLANKAIADAAAADAAEALALAGFVAKAFGRIAVGDTSGEFVVQRQIGCTVAYVSVDGVKYTATVTFAAAAADDNWPGPFFSEQSATITAKSAAGFTFTTPISGTTAHLSFACFP